MCRSGSPTSYYARRSLGVRQFVQISGDTERDLALLRAFYADKAGLHPHHAIATAFCAWRENDRIS